MGMTKSEWSNDEDQANGEVAWRRWHPPELSRPFRALVVGGMGSGCFQGCMGCAHLPFAKLCRPFGAWPCWPGCSCVRRTMKWCSREELHLELPLSQSGVQVCYTSGAWKRDGAACRCCPDTLCLEDRHACCYINAAWKVVLGFSPRGVFACEWRCSDLRGWSRAKAHDYFA